ncbi:MULTISPECIES: polyprenyl diphosphate synthase [unclassified Acinetobacter]|uniref:polyprenyl diphosphate synthase n=1 Tax=unclassified Acinetobacter TaxID=196816 RepID=UPI00293525DB|nr:MULTISPECIES: polyprenyl diphosphate synthase [unclassified Acinetobacter]WOE31887.1 polyprenyl diphosphate synthase [Acinetobacter sp. SAAs470]WOE37354.1 polyprenyl diphosphate synthase [Acinetobacter sp. SAAs474]
MTLIEDTQNLPKHVAIIMDGNNRFAKKNHMSPGDGHREGKNILDPIVEFCCQQKIQALTVFAFSTENWNRPQFEVDLLMQLFEDTIYEQIQRMAKYNIAFRFIGDRSKLSEKLQALMLEAEQKTPQNVAMVLTIAMSYGGMWDIAQAAKQLAQDVVDHKININQIDENIFAQYVCLSDLPPVDLLIRTGGDYRISNFLLWQTAYAELYFTPTLWPEFTVEEMLNAFAIFSRRERRFGKTSEQTQQVKLEK